MIPSGGRKRSKTTASLDIFPQAIFQTTKKKNAMGCGLLFLPSNLLESLLQATDCAKSRFLTSAQSDSHLGRPSVQKKVTKLRTLSVAPLAPPPPLHLCITLGVSFLKKYVYVLFSSFKKAYVILGKTPPKAME